MGFLSKLGKSLKGAVGLGGMGPMGQNPSNAGMQYLNQIPGAGRENYEPYIKEGREASNIANPQYNQMASNPYEFLNNIIKSYSPSEGYKFRENRLRNEMGNTAAAGGFRGTQYDQEQQGQAINGILGEDMQQFLQNILGIQGAGLQGQENRIGRGFQSSGNLADYLGSNLGQQANYAAQGQNYQNNYNMSNRLNKSNARLGLLSRGIGAAANVLMPGSGQGMGG